jgi:dihydrodipicolinate synthase/N-acetylneuraminate lyase
MNGLAGVYVPLVTPFHDGDVDLESLRGLVRHYRSTGVDGLVLPGTTGESPTIDAAEQRSLVAATLVAQPTSSSAVTTSITAAVAPCMPKAAALRPR